MVINSDPSTLNEQASSTDTEQDQRGPSAKVSTSAQQKTASSDKFQPISPLQLEFTEQEKQDIKQLWLMFRTPRTVKRFINIYRLLRAGLVSDTEVKSFEGTSDQPGEYQVALLLLATITAFANESSRFLHHLDAWLDAAEQNEECNSASWGEILEFLRAKTIRRSGSSVIEKDHQTPDEHLQRQMTNVGNIALDNGEETQTSDDSWILMLDCLDRVTQYKTWKSSFTPAALRVWVMRVARFSFSVQPT